MARFTSLLCAYLLYSGLPSSYGQPLLDTGQGQDQGQGQSQGRNRGQGIQVLGSSLSRPNIKLGGLCRDGWRSGRMRNAAGGEVSVCLKVNTQELSWQEAQQACRKDYGFLIKLDTAAMVDDKDLFAAIYGSGITKFWTGLHTDHEHLAWDDIVPNKVQPYISANTTDRSSRPWRWDKSLLDSRDEYCGQMNIHNGDDKKRRRRRSPDDDDAPMNFDMSKFQNNPFTNSFGNIANNQRPLMAESLQSFISRSPINKATNVLPSKRNIQPRTSAFQSTLSRTPSMDSLDELPSSSFGVRSDLQIPGSGLSETNLEKGGLATFRPSFEATTESDGDRDVPSSNTDRASNLVESASNNENSDHSGTNTDEGLHNSVSNDNQNSFDNTNSVRGDLLDAVREAAKQAQGLSAAISDPPNDPIDILKSQINENDKSLGKGDTNSNTRQANGISSHFSTLTTTISPLPIGAQVIGLDNIVGNLLEHAENVMTDLSDNSAETESMISNSDDDSKDRIESTISKLTPDQENDKKDASGLSDDETPNILEQNTSILDDVIKGESGSKASESLLNSYEEGPVLTSKPPLLNIDGGLKDEDDDDRSGPVVTSPAGITQDDIDDVTRAIDTVSNMDIENINPLQNTISDSADESLSKDREDKIETLQNVVEAIKDTNEENKIFDNSVKPIIETENENTNTDTSDEQETFADLHESIRNQIGDHLENVNDNLGQSDDLPSSEQESDDSIEDIDNIESHQPEVDTESNNEVSEASDDHFDQGSELLTETENNESSDTENENVEPAIGLGNVPNIIDSITSLHNTNEESNNDSENNDNDDNILPAPRDNTGEINNNDRNTAKGDIEREDNQESEALEDAVDTQQPINNLYNKIFDDSDAEEGNAERDDETGVVQSVVIPPESETERNDFDEVFEDQNLQSAIQGTDSTEHSEQDDMPEDLSDLADIQNDLHEVMEQATIREAIGSGRGKVLENVPQGTDDDDEHENDTLDNNMDVEDNDSTNEQSDRSTTSPVAITEVDEDDDDNNDDANDDTFDITEDATENNGQSTAVTALSPLFNDNTMGLSSCEVRLPSVCFSYQVEVKDKASTCDDGWYGHVLLDTCYLIVDKKYDYSSAVSFCASLGARLVLSDSQLERNFVLLAVQKESIKFRGGKFWMETPVSRQQSGCDYFDERGVQQQPTCNSAMYAVCVKDAKPLSVSFTADALSRAGLQQQDRLFSSKSGNNSLLCDLYSGASEFPVLWFKDGVLLDTKDTQISSDTSLRVEPSLLAGLSTALDKQLGMPALQGRYWCEVWDRQSLSRHKSSAYNVRFSDVITFHGSMEVGAVTHQDEIRYNMINERLPGVNDVEEDLRKVFRDVLPLLQTSQPDVTDVFTYVDKIRSSPSVVEYHTYFVLSRDVRADDEDAIYAKIKSILRAHLGNRNYMASLPGGTTISEFRTMSLQSTVSCPAATLQTSRDLFGNIGPVRVFSFPKALLGDFANSLDTCSPTNPMPAGTARCLGDFYTGAYWGEVVANECVEEVPIDALNQEIWGASPFTDKLSQMAQTPIDATNAGQLIDEVSRISNVAVKLTPTDINKIADVLDHTTQVAYLGKKDGEAILKTVDKLMTTNRREAHIANIETKAANRIIKSVERFAENANLHGQKNLRVVSENVVLEVWDLAADDQPVIGLAARSHMTEQTFGFTEQNIATIYNKSHLEASDVDAAIELPVEVFSKKEKGERLTNRLTMMVFRQNELFQAAVSDNGQKISPTADKIDNLNSYVISASIAGRKLSGLKEKVRTIFKPLKESGGERTCVWWNFDLHEEKGGWSTDGCYYDGRVNGRDVCLCDHLTNFAVLLDFYGQAEPIPEAHNLSLSIITILGLSCSIIGLCLTIISYVFFKKLRKGRAQQTLFNLSLALLFSMLVFLVGIKQTHSYWGCVGVAILLHYFIMASFMWMLMEAVLQYLTFVKILGTYITRFTLKTVIPAWGLPLIPVIAVLSVDYNLYKGGPNYCWMDLPAFYYAFVIPVSLIILINVVIFVITVISIFRRGKGLRSNQKKHKMAVTNLQAAITSFVLLGLTWMFGYLAISDARLPFQYIFTILNSLQGFFIFVLFVLRKKKVREQWYIICCRPGDQDRVSRTLSASNSSYSNSSNRTSRNKHERDRSDSTKTVQSTYSNSSDGFTNYGYDHGFEFPYNRYDKRAFRKL